MQRCNMQLATKPITTAIKLATLQQNGRRNVHHACDDVVFTNIFLKFVQYAGQHIRLIQSYTSDTDIIWVELHVKVHRTIGRLRDQ